MKKLKQNCKKMDIIQMKINFYYRALETEVNIKTLTEEKSQVERELLSHCFHLTSKQYIQ